MSEGGQGLPETRSLAKSSGASKYLTGRPCPKGHVSARWTINGTCVACHATWANDFKKRNPEKCRVYQQTYWAKPEAKEVNRAASARVRKNNPGRSTVWGRENVQSCRERARKWDVDNPDKVAAKNARRRSAKLNATPIWADMKAISNIYTRCAEVSRVSGIKYHVDHIVPLRGDDVCGLHVEYNLRIIPAAENQRKSNLMLPYNHEVV